MNNVIASICLLLSTCGCCVLTPTMNAILNGNAKIENNEQKEVVKTEEVQIVNEPSLWDMTDPESHIDEDDCFSHDGKMIQVLQVVDGSLNSNVGNCFVICTPRHFDYDRMTIGVISRHDYVTGEMLRPGRYQYAKPYTYRNKNGDRRTIRLFYELPRENELTDSEKGIQK